MFRAIARFKVIWRGNISRRKFIKASLFSGIGLLLSKLVRADDLANLIESNSSDSGDSPSINQIIALRIWPSNIYTRVTIETQARTQAKYFTLANPDRLVINIKNAQLNDVVKTLQSQVVANDPVIDGVKVGQFDSDTVRVVVYLKTVIKVQTQILEPVKFGSVDYRYRYLLDIYNANANNDNLNDDLLAALQLDSESGTMIKRQDYPTIQAPSSVPTKHAKKIIIMLDPGHGGEDPGAIGHSSLQEKHVVLDIAFRLRNLINRTGYIHAEMTRTADIFIPLGTRVAIARKVRADLFMSIHADAFTSPEPSGSSVFMLSDKAASSTFARWLARTQNQSDLIGGISFKTESAPVKKVLLDMSQTWTRRQSSRFGTLAIDNISKVHKMHNRVVEQANFAVLKAPDIPSILVETAFISNLADEALLKTDVFKDAIAQALFAGIDDYAKSLLG